MTSSLALATLVFVGGAVSDLETHLTKAADLAVHDEIEAAIDAYRVLLDEGTEVPGLHYNLGTLYLEAGDVGPAVLHLRSALHRDPADEDAAHNLEVALAGRADQLQGVGPGLSFWQELGRGVRPQVAQAAFLLPFGLLLLVVAGYGVLAPRRWMRAIVAALTLATLLGGLVLVARAEADVEEVAVVLEGTDARKGPSPTAAVSFSAHPGLSGTVRERSGGFARLRLDNGVEAWLDEAALGVVE